MTEQGRNLDPGALDCGCDLCDCGDPTVVAQRRAEGMGGRISGDSCSLLTPGANLRSVHNFEPGQVSGWSSA